jgi:GNAT superfamily N-acetyltransferase
MPNFRKAGFSVDTLKVADFKSARDIFKNTFLETPIGNFQHSWRQRIRSSSLGMYTKEGDLVGFLLANVGGYKYRNTHIDYLAIHPLYQKFRLGSCLLETLLEKECEARRNVTLTPLYSDHVWYWYHKEGFYVTQYSKARGGGIHALMNFHPYPTRNHNRYLWFPSLLPVGGCSDRHVF